MAVGIIATLRVVDGKQAEFEAGFAKMQEVVKAEETGCLLYDLVSRQDGRHNLSGYGTICR